MADLRERLEAAILCLSLLDKEGVKLTSTIATLREVLAHPEKLSSPSATAAITEPLGVFSDGKWTFDETGQQFTSQQLDNAAFFVYRPHLAAAPTAPVVEAGATGWIAAHESGRIHHFSIADGWTVEVVTK